ncbi:MAG: DUF952 domain-containing protein [Mobilicoccus sp.]|nr:DUF952 domain-containing protein [Mobilicoccus sp.]
MMIPVIFHLAFASDWQAAQQVGEYRISTRGMTIDEVGFLHACSDDTQLNGVAERFYADVTDPLVVIHLDETVLASHGLDARLEPGDPAVSSSPLFPHVYGGPVPVAAVSDVTPFTATASEPEWWDVLDVRGLPTGRRHRRGAPGLTEGECHLVVGVCVTRPDGCLLISQRASTKEWPLQWEFAAGSALAGESSARAAARELAEEVGIHVDPADLHLIGRRREPATLFDFYRVLVPGDTTVTVDPTEVATARWVTVADVAGLSAAGEFAEPWTERLAVWLEHLDGPEGPARGSRP